MVVGIYIRVSTEEQVQEGYSISAQRERLKAFCIAQNWDEYKFYVDEGISGRSTNRPQLKKLMKDIEDGHISTLLVYRLDRMTRSVRDLHKILDHLEKYNCVFRSATEIYDTSTAMGRMFITIVAAIAEWESENLGERVKMGQIEKARQGEWAAQPPYGWYKDEKHKLQQNKEEIEAVKLMVNKIREGYSFRQLSEYMDSSKYKPRRGYKWHITTLMMLMHNPVLYGAMYWGGNTYENTHEGIMTKEEFEELQSIIKSRQNYKKRNVKSAFIYQMKIVCPDCGNRCTSERSVWRNKNGEQRVGHTYRCQACALNNRERTPFHVQEKHVTEMLLEYMNNITLTKSPKNNKKEHSPADGILEEMNIIKRQREKYQRAWSIDQMTDDEFTNLMQETRLRYDDLQKQLESIDNVIYDNVDIEKQREIATNFVNNFKNLTQEEQRSFVQTFIESVKIRVVKPASTKRSRDRILEITSAHFY